MADEIKIIVQNKLRKKINEVKTKRPSTFEKLIKFINEKIFIFHKMVKELQ